MTACFNIHTSYMYDLCCNPSPKLYTGELFLVNFIKVDRKIKRFKVEKKEEKN